MTSRSSLSAAEADVLITAAAWATSAVDVSGRNSRAADDGLALAAAAQLREHDVASVAVHPGWVRTDRVLLYADRLDLTHSQSPEGVGRAIAALANDPDVLRLTGRALSVDVLADLYGVDVTT